MEETTKKTIEMMGIYELRTLARNVGVPSPTTLKRQQLLEAIYDILDGVKEGTPLKKVGRPPKKIKLDTSVMDVFVPQDFIDYANEEQEKLYSSESLVFQQELDLTRFNNRIRVERKGYLRSTKSGAYFFKDSNTLVFVSPNLAAEMNIVEGDFIEGGAWQVQGKPYEIFYAPEKVNGEKVEEVKRNLVNFINIQIPTSPEESQRKFYKIHDIPTYISEVLPLLKNYESKGYKINILAVGLIPENVLRIRSAFDGVKHKAFVSYFEDGPKESFETALDAINNSIALARSGEKVVLFVFDVATLLSELKIYFNEKTEGSINSNTILIMRKLFSINRSLVGGGACTLIAGSSENIDLINYI